MLFFIFPWIQNENLSYFYPGDDDDMETLITISPYLGNDLRMTGSFIIIDLLILSTILFVNGYKMFSIFNHFFVKKITNIFLSVTFLFPSISYHQSIMLNLISLNSSCIHECCLSILTQFLQHLSI